MNADERMSICMQCKLMTESSAYGPRCDASKWINPKTGEISRSPKPGWINGCNCYLKMKTKDPTAHCKLKKW